MGVRFTALRDRFIKFARRSTRAQLQVARAKLRYRLLARLPKIPHAGNDRTLYVIGLFGTGRSYINELLVHNIGERAKYFRDEIRFHPSPTSMIYCGHATVKHVSVLQHQPEIINLILEAARSGFGDLIFIHRHPLDLLLTNWVWWRNYLRDGRMIKGTSQVYRSEDELCTALDKNAAEFVEDLGLTSMSIVPPRTKPYGHLAVKEKVPRFRTFINDLDAEAKKRIERIGYNVDGLN